MQQKIHVAISNAITNNKDNVLCVFTWGTIPRVANGGCEDSRNCWSLWNIRYCKTNQHN